MHRHATAPAITERDLRGCALVRRVARAIVARLQRLDGPIAVQGDHLIALPFAPESRISDRSLPLLDFPS